MFFGTLHQLTQGLSGSEAIIAIKENHKLSPSHFDGFFSDSQQTFIFLIPNKFKPHVPMCETLAYLLCIIRTRIIYNNKLGIQVSLLNQRSKTLIKIFVYVVSSNQNTEIRGAHPSDLTKKTAVDYSIKDE